MQSYNCFLLDKDGRLSDVIFADCADDADAVQWAEKLLHRNPEYRHAELWQADRLVAPRVKPEILS